MELWLPTHMAVSLPRFEPQSHFFIEKKSSVAHLSQLQRLIPLVYCAGLSSTCSNSRSRAPRPVRNRRDAQQRRRRARIPVFRKRDHDQADQRFRKNAW